MASHHSTRSVSSGNKSPDEDGSSTKELHREHDQLSDDSVEQKQPWYNPRYWRRRTWIILGVVTAVALAIAVPVGVTVERSRNRYPNYTRINYGLAETCESGELQQCGMG